MGDLAERQNRPQLSHCGDFGNKKAAAGVHFHRQWLIFRRDTPDGVADADGLQCEAIIPPRTIFSFRQPESFERAIEKIARIIACERASRAVGAFQPRCKADNQQFRIQRTETGNRVVEEIRKCRPVLPAELGEPRA